MSEQLAGFTSRDREIGLVILGILNDLGVPMTSTVLTESVMEQFVGKEQPTEYDLDVVLEQLEYDFEVIKDVAASTDLEPIFEITPLGRRLLAASSRILPE